MNLIEQIARKIDTEGAYSEWFDGTGLDAKKILPTTRQKYYRSRAEHLASEVAKIILEAGIERLRSDAENFEIECWGKLGLPISDDLKRIVADKYA